ncbi:hypothetical protein [Streptomyces werraensis]|uniref:hypothetical protein n=1 Tax=Streptomyces werraensis TaxID=68284 RepID=UPI0033BA18DE
MPQEPAGRAAARKPALALLVGLALMLMAHVVACAVHPTGSPHHTAASGHAVHTESGTNVLLAPDTSAWPADHGGHEHPVPGAMCCDPADWPADVRAPAGTLLLALLLLGLIVLRRRPDDEAMSGAPPGRRDTAATPLLSGAHLLRLVCVSRT